MDFDVDLLTIGGGSGGVAASRRASAHGARVALVERDRVGGTCVIRGCVPKKLMMYAGQIGDALAQAEAFGWSVAPGAFDLARWTDAKAREINRLESLYEDMLAGAGVSLVRGEARILDAHTVAVGEQRLTARHILIATGSHPVRNAVPGLEHALTSNEILNLRQVPRRLAVIGVGYIGMEFASIMNALGAHVTVVSRRDLPLRGFDEDLRKHLRTALEVRGIHWIGGHPPLAVVRHANGLRVQLKEGAEIDADAVLDATGRRPNAAAMGLEALGIVLDAKGAIPVDADSRTAVPSIHAIGDVTDRMNLTPVAIAEGRAFADHVFGGKTVRLDYSRIASAVFTSPPIGTVGLTEAQARTRGRLRVYESDFRPMKTAFTGGSQRTYMKLVVDDASDRVLGVHMLGDDAPEIVQSLAVALQSGATKADFDRTVAVHPTAAEEFVLMRQPSREVEQEKESGTP